MGLWGTLTGKTLEKKVREYGEITSEVLLGLHRDVSAIDTQVSTVKAELDSVREAMERVHSRLTALEAAGAHHAQPEAVLQAQSKELRKRRRWAIVACALALSSGVMSWLIR